MNTYASMKQTGYRPFHATKRLNNGVSEPLDELEENLQETLRSFVREHVRGVFFLGLKSSSMSNFRSQFPRFFSFLFKNYPDFLDSCKFATKSRDRTTKPIPYVLLPDQNLTLISWDSVGRCPQFLNSEDLKRSIQNLK